MNIPAVNLPGVDGPGGTPPSPPNFVLPTPAATGLVFPGVEPVPVPGVPIPPPPPVVLRKIPNERTS